MNISSPNPNTIEHALGLIRARYREMSLSQKRLANFILEKPFELAFASAAAVGQQAGVSPATAVRFAEFLGLSGYADLQKLARNAVHREINEVTEFKLTSSVLTGQSILHKCLRTDIECIERTANLLSEAVFEKAIRVVEGARTVYIAGFRSTYGLASQFAFNLNLIGRRAFALTPNVGDLSEQLLSIGADDVCIAISFRRYTAQTVSVVEYARERRIPIVAITDSLVSPIAELANITLPVAVKFPSFLESRAAALGVINALMVGVALMHRGRTSEALAAHEKLWARRGVYFEDPSSETHSHKGAFEFLERDSVTPPTTPRKLKSSRNICRPTRKS